MNNNFRRNRVPIIIMLVDIIVVLFSIFLSVQIRGNFTWSAFQGGDIARSFIIILIVRCICFLIFKTNKILIRFFSNKDIFKLSWINLIGSAVFVAANLISLLVKDIHIIPYSIVIMEFFFTSFLMIFYRMVLKSISTDNNSDIPLKNILIFGAGELGSMIIRTITHENKYKIVGFLDEDTTKIGKTIKGYSIFALSKLEQLLKEKSISFLIIAIENLSIEKRTQVTDIATAYNVKILMIPPLNKWVNGELSFKQIKKIRIEDLLGRSPIKLNDKGILQQLNGKTILVTGAAGSIGSEIVRQLFKYDFKEIVLVDNAESPMYFLELDLFNMHTNKKYTTYIGDICQPKFMEKIFQTYHPDIVYHAAAYKHVPLMEKNPFQAVRVNVYGTKMLADLSMKYNVEKFIMISTDKAVNPTNIMGASKRIAETYVQSLDQTGTSCKFVTTRFGNVLGSNGSVIPIFQQQIDKGGPVTITHPEVTRYFMTIPEACQLVLQAGYMGNGGEIFIFDMGESVKIYDLAKKMISLSGLKLGVDISIVFTGLRPGEKLYEEVLATEENSTATQHDKIKIAKIRTYQWEKVKQMTDELIGLLNTDDEFSLVKQMKVIVPEFKSQNSVFMTLDKDN